MLYPNIFRGAIIFILFSELICSILAKNAITTQR